MSAGSRTIKPTSALIAALLTLTGCTPDDGAGTSRQNSPTAEQPSGGAAQPGQPGQPLASREVQNDGATLRVDLTGLERTDRLLTLSWNITVTKADADGDWTMSAKLSANPAGTSASDYDVSGVTLVDPVNSKRHLVARSAGTGDGPGPCVCSKASPYLHAGEGASFYATFSAPPADITKVNVDLVIGTFDDVPVS